MKLFKGFVLLTVLLSLSGCNKCRNYDCVYDQPFLFKLVDSDGENVLINGTLRAEQIAITSVNRPDEPVYLETFENIEGDTLLEFFLLRYVRRLPARNRRIW